jgi:hypothetical protein
MPGNRIAITVEAIDGASARLEAINKRIAAMTAPIAKLQKSFGRFADASGVTKLSKGFAELSRGSLDAFRNISRVVAPLGAITSAASVAGMVKLTTAWADFGSQLGFTARNLGMSASALQTFQGAATLAGSSSSALNSGLQTLGQNMWNAVGGRAPEVTAAFRYLHLSFQNADGSARSLGTMMPLIADKIKAIQNPFAQAAVATALFGGAAQDLLPFLRLGSAGMAEYEAKAQRYGVMNAAGVTAANNMRMAQAGLTLAVQGLGNAIAERLAPVLDPMINQLADWIAANRGWIATDITKYVVKFSNWLMVVGPQVQTVVDRLGGWEDAARDLAVFMGVSWLAKMMAPIITVTAALTRVIALMATASAPIAYPAALLAGGAAALAGSYYDFTHPAQFKNMYLQRDARIAAAGKAQLPKDVEAYLTAAAVKNGLDPKYLIALARQEAGGYDNVSSAGAIGPMQLLPGTASDMGVQNIHDWRQNIDGGTKYFAQLLARFHGNYDAAAAAYNAGAAGAGVGYFASSGDASQLPNQTQNYVASIDALYPTSGPAANIGDGSGVVAGAAPPVLKVDVTHNNPPPGTTAKVSSNSPQVQVSSLKVVKSMSGGPT